MIEIKADSAEDAMKMFFEELTCLIKGFRRGDIWLRTHMNYVFVEGKEPFFAPEKEIF